MEQQLMCSSAQWAHFLEHTGCECLEGRDASQSTTNEHTVAGRIIILVMRLARAPGGLWPLAIAGNCCSQRCAPIN